MIIVPEPEILIPDPIEIPFIPEITDFEPRIIDDSVLIEVDPERNPEGKSFHQMF